MTLLSLDQSTSKTGFGVFCDGKLQSSGLICPPKSVEGINDRIYYMYKEIRKLIVKHSPDYIVFEDTTLNKIQNVEVMKWLCRLQGFVLCLCHEFNIQHILLYPTTWRSVLGFLVGKDKKREAQKAFAIEYVNKTHNMTLGKSDDDQAEAVAIGDAFLKMKNNA